MPRTYKCPECEGTGPQPENRAHFIGCKTGQREREARLAAAPPGPACYPSHLAELDEAVLLLIRKLGNLDPNVFDELAAKMPPGAMEVLMGAEARADAARHADERAGITRTFAF